MVSCYEQVMLTVLTVTFAEKLDVLLVKCLVLLEGNATYTHNSIIKLFLDRVTDENHKSDSGVSLGFMVSLDVTCHTATPSLILLQLGTVRSISV